MNPSYTRKLVIFSSLTLLMGTLSIAQISYVAPDGSGDGSSWQNASADLLLVLANASDGDEVWVAQGNYKTVECSGCSDAERNTSFELKEGVKLYGGFSGNETALSQRDPSIYETILDGDIGVPADKSDNSYTILQIGSVTTSVVDGFTFQNGSATEGFSDQLGPKNSGGAIHVKANSDGQFSSPTIKNCIFRNNEADSYGGAIHVYGGFNGHGKADIIDCRFEENFAPKQGGAVYLYAAFEGTIEGMISGCTFSQNAAVEGGAVCVLSSGNGMANVQMDNCTFAYNWSLTSGGAILTYAAGGANHSSYQDCLFYNNSSKQGGAFFNDSRFGGVSHPTFLRCTFKSNSAVDSGAGVYNNANEGTSNPIYTDCTFQLNYTSQSGAALFNNATDGICNPTFERCYFLDNIVEMYGGAMYNQGKGGACSPVITNCLFRRNKANSAGAIYNYGGESGNSSAIIQNCTFVGNEANVGACIYNQASDVTGNVQTLVSNCIFWKNEAFSGFGKVFQNGYAEPTIQYSLIPFNDCDSLNTDSNSTVTCETGLLFNVNPKFIDADNMNYRLADDSPLIDSGLLPGGIIMDKDLDGFPRINNGILDLGAYENGPITGPTVITQSLSGVYCLGDSIGIEVNASDEEAMTYQWFKDNMVITGANANVLILEDLTIGDEGNYHCSISQSGQSATSNEIQISLNQTVDPVLDLDPSTAQFCAGENQIEVDLDITNVGFFPSVTWLLNGQEVSTDLGSYSFLAQDGDVLTANYMGLKACIAGKEFMAEPISFSEENMVTPQISIQLNETSYCEGDLVTANAETENAGENAMIAWFINGQMMADGTEDSFSSDIFENGDMLTAQLSSTLSCVTDPIANSSAESIIVFPITNPDVVLIDSNDSLCLNEELLFEAQISDAGDTPEITWKVDGIEQNIDDPILNYTFDQNGAHTVQVAINSSDQCPALSIVSAILEFEVKTCLVNTTPELYTGNLKIWPNPSSEFISIDWDQALGTDVDFRIKDVKGVEQFIPKSDILSHRSGAQIRVNNLNSGCYYLIVQSKKYAISRPVIILK